MVNETLPPYDPDENRREAMMNGSGFSAADAYGRHPESLPDGDNPEIIPPVKGAKKHTRKPARRRFTGGRAGNLGSDWENTPELQGGNFTGPLSDEKIASRNKGIELVRCAIKESLAPEPEREKRPPQDVVTAASASWDEIEKKIASSHSS